MIMNKEYQKEFLSTFKNPSELIEDDDKALIAQNMQNDILSSLGSELLGNNSLNIEDVDIDLFLSTCEEMEINPIEIIEEILTSTLNSKKTFKIHDKDISLEGLPDFFKKAKENFIKQKESEDINNF